MRNKKIFYGILIVAGLVVFGIGFSIYQNIFIPIGRIVISPAEPQKDTCTNLCGDGICQEIVCVAIGCPCPETPETCPRDCGRKVETYCDADNPCPQGQECYKSEDEESPICWEGDPCAKCESGNCVVAESYPIQVFCR